MKRFIFLWIWIITCVLAISTEQTVAAAEVIPLRAGPVRLVFDAERLFARYIRVGEHEILRGINAPIRDSQWATILPEVSNLLIDDGGDHFAVSFDAVCRHAEIDFRWKGRLTGHADGTIEFIFDGEAHSTFRRNRIGFCVLHGPSAAGQPWILETVDGKQQHGNFPDLISPHQPAKNLRAITHTLANDLQARVEFTGEVFEMEDQRNWTDASFKTYCTPLALPYPVEIAQGTHIHQAIRISVRGDTSGLDSRTTDTVVLRRGDARQALPRLGVQVSQEVRELTEQQVALLRELHLDHLRVNIGLSDPHFASELTRATEQARRLGVQLHVGLYLGKKPALSEFAAIVHHFEPSVSHWLWIPPATADPQQDPTALSTVLKRQPLGVSYITNFVDLNRSRPTSADMGSIGFAINPQVHAFDQASMVETLPIQADAVRTAQQFAGKSQLVIGPITLAPQPFFGEDQPGGPPAGRFPTHVDPRQSTPFAAAWTLGSLKYLAQAGAAAATYYETIGWNGLIDVDDASSRPAGYPSRPGEPFPVYHLMRAVGEFAGGQVVEVTSSNPLAAESLVLEGHGKRRILIANLREEPTTVTLQGFHGAPVMLTMSDGTQVTSSPAIQVTLTPGAIARIDQQIDSGGEGAGAEPEARQDPQAR